jgi:hypothetical protein
MSRLTELAQAHADEEVTKQFREFREQQRISLQSLLSHYCGDKNLCDALLDKLTYYQDDACLSGERAGNTLNDMICKMTLAYKPNPSTKSELLQNSTLLLDTDTAKSIIPPLATGENGEIYKHTLNMKPFDRDTIVTKVSKKFSIDTLKEAVVNMCIINDYLEKNPYAPLIPTYGFFLCNQEISPGHPAKICFISEGHRVKDGPRLFIVQKHLEGTMTLHAYIKSPSATVARVQQIIVRVLRTLIDLQNGPFKLSHGDLHSKNILVTPDGLKCWIIDWGYASFTLNGRRYLGFSEMEYNTQADIIISGACDIYFLLGSLRYTTNQDIKEWGGSIRSELFDMSLDDPESEDRRCFLVDEVFHGAILPIAYNTEVGMKGDGKELCFGEALWLYRALIYVENHSMSDKSLLHQENIRLLNLYTYGYLFDKLKEIDRSLNIAEEFVMEEEEGIAKLKEQGRRKKSRHRLQKTRHARLRVHKINKKIKTC